jgi:hypothetical protein
VSNSDQQDAWVKAWAERYPAPKDKKSTRGGLRSRSPRRRLLLIGLVVLGALIVPAVAFAAGAQTFSSSSSRYTATIRNSGTGGATAQTCNTSTSQPACENNVNFGTNFAATYRTKGPTAVYFQTSGQGQATPFLLSPNATGEVQFLNANMVGGLTAQQLFSGYQQISSTSSSVSGGNGTTTSATVTCPAGTNIISQSGAVNQSSGGAGQAALRGVTPTSSTSATATGVVIGPGGADSTFTVTAYAVCAQT